MSAPIGPGDWVECVGAPPGTPKNCILKSKMNRGPFCVAAVGEWRGLGWLLCVGQPHPGEIDPLWRHVPGWDVRGYRLIYRPNGELIADLMRRSREPLREPADAREHSSPRQVPQPIREDH